MYFIYYFYLLLYFSSKTFIDFIPTQNKIDNSKIVCNENKLNKIQTNNLNFLYIYIHYYMKKYINIYNNRYMEK